MPITDEQEAEGAPVTQAAPAAGEGEVMLDVHPPHAAIHGWRDFFVHIATITIGLLIAIGLEQTVEYIHHREQLSDARRAITAELNDNRRIAKLNDAEFVRVKAMLAKDMEILRTSWAANAPVTTGLNYGWLFYRTPDGAWQTAKQNGALSLMPNGELQDYVYDYAVFSAFMDALTVATTEMEVAGAISHRAPGGALNAKDIEDLIAATSDTQGKLNLAAKFLEFEELNLAGVKVRDDGPEFIRRERGL